MDGASAVCIVCMDCVHRNWININENRIDMNVTNVIWPLKLLERKINTKKIIFPKNHPNESVTKFSEHLMKMSRNPELYDLYFFDHCHWFGTFHEDIYATLNYFKCYFCDNCYGFGTFHENIGTFDEDVTQPWIVLSVTFVTIPNLWISRVY